MQGAAPDPENDALKLSIALAATALRTNVSVNQLEAPLTLPHLPLGSKVIAQPPTRSTQRLANGTTLAVWTFQDKPKKAVVTAMQF